MNQGHLFLPSFKFFLLTPMKKNLSASAESLSFETFLEYIFDRFKFPTKFPLKIWSVCEHSCVSKNISKEEKKLKAGRLPNQLEDE